MDNSSLAHSKWNCKYHIVFAPKYRYLKGKSSLMIFDRHANLKYRYGNRQFWCKGYYVDTVGKNTKKIKEYIAHQLEEDGLSEQLTMEYIDPFTCTK
ncbi:MAG: transposase [Clostridium sp.]|uniref:transposase n=1 Tax=Clostridium sp. TaxID=1506 RepID=UPI00290304D7|nr:transposase [Clostridium sp.]MDU2754499.1 transposase [Clostridium sp.]